MCWAVSALGEICCVPIVALAATTGARQRNSFMNFIYSHGPSCHGLTDMTHVPRCGGEFLPFFSSSLDDVPWRDVYVAIDLLAHVGTWSQTAVTIADVDSSLLCFMHVLERGRKLNQRQS